MSFSRAGLLVLAVSIAGVCAGATNETVSWISITNRIGPSLGLTNVTPTADGLTISNEQHTLRLYTGRRYAILDWVTVWLHIPPRDAATNDLRDLALPDYDRLLRPILLATSTPPAQLRIVLDAGHGGDDPGAQASGKTVLEKNVSLDVARHTARMLRMAGHEVWLTHSNDTLRTLGERIRFATNRHAQVFVSIHANFSPINPHAQGVETYVLTASGYVSTEERPHVSLSPCPGNRFDASNALLGFAIHRRCVPLASMDRGLKRARYYVLRDAPCPAVLIECGFLSNTNDVAHLGDTAYRRRLADAIAAGIQDYASQLPDPCADLRSNSAFYKLKNALTPAEPPATNEVDHTTR